jgi:hypothetical protein
MSKLLLSLMQWSCYWLAWASVALVIATLIASTGLTGENPLTFVPIHFGGDGCYIIIIIIIKWPTSVRSYPG